MDAVAEEMLRALLRGALRRAGGDRVAALHLAIEGAAQAPALAEALRASLEATEWGRLVREELTGRG